MFRFMLHVALFGAAFTPLSSNAQNTETQVQRALVMKVGDTVVLRGPNAGCPADDAAPQAVTPYQTGSIVTSSSRCGGRMTMAQTLFVAERPGEETIQLRQDNLRVRVTE